MALPPVAILFSRFGPRVRPPAFPETIVSLSHHLAAVWFADVVGYTRLSEENEGEAVRAESSVCPPRPVKRKRRHWMPAQLMALSCSPR